MKIVQKPAAMQEPELLSLCAVETAGQVFGIDTRGIHEVLGRKRMQCVPLAPAFIGGMVPYRGEVLTAVSLRALLGEPPARTESYVLVMESEEADEPFGLMVDEVGGVVMVEAQKHEPNPAMLDHARQALFSGAFRLPEGLLVRLDPHDLHPALLARREWLQPSTAKKLQSVKEEAPCER